MGLAGTNLEHARGYNRRVVLEMIRLHGPLSRAQMARQTGLSVQAVHNIVDDLARADLVLSRKTETGGRGQPASEIVINPAGGYTIGISFDHRRLVVVLVDLAGTQIGLRDQALAEPQPDKMLELIEEAIGQLCRDKELRAKIWGVGVVMPALIESGSLVSFGPSSMPHWEGYPLAERLHARLGLPVYVENDATAAAVGEHLYGIGQRLKDFFYIYIGAGIGSGMIFAGHPYSGSAGRAGELGHVTVVRDGRPCQCGNRGCLERYVSLSAAQCFVTGVAEGVTAVDPAILARAYEAGDERLSQWIGEAAGHLRQAIVMIENLLDPETIVIGGILPEPVMEAVIAGMEPLPASVRSRVETGMPRLCKAEVGLETPALGAAALPLFNGLTPSFKLLADRGQASPAVLRAS